jgi:LacI family gluconate utilization system Gnt-I transcriptional repressor
MDACRLEIGRAAAKIICDAMDENGTDHETQITLTPKISYGDTLKRR